jgi:hypothetical protein
MMCRRLARAIVVMLAVIAAASTIVHAALPEPVFRVFLKNGTALACWGEYARVGDQLVLTVPIGRGPRAAYEFVSLPVSAVDLDKTERYAEAVRAQQFAATRGKAEFAALNERLADQLASISLIPDPQQRLAVAENARQQLIDWAATSHGYRAREVQQLLRLFDAAIINLRVALGQSQFSISLSGGTTPPPPVKLRAAPTTRETVDLALKAAMAVNSLDIRKNLLRRARTTVAVLPADDRIANELRASIAREWTKALRTESAYLRLDLDVRRLVDRAVDRGDVIAIDALRERVTRTDRLLGGQRPEIVIPLVELLDRERDRAAEQRLVLDSWEARRSELVEYQNDVEGLLKSMDSLGATLTAIKLMSGPPLTSLVMDQRQTEAMVAEFRQLKPPEDASTAHLLIGLAIEQTDAAVRTRRQAVETRQMSAAREASAAAGDAQTRLVQGKAALRAALEPPKAIR